MGNLMLWNIVEAKVALLGMLIELVLVIGGKVGKGGSIPDVWLVDVFTITGPEITLIPTIISAVVVVVELDGAVELGTLLRMPWLLVVFWGWDVTD